MTVTIDTTLTGWVVDGWKVVYSSGLSDPVFYIWVDGVRIIETRETEYLVSVGDGVFPVVDVFDDANATPDFARSARETLCWREVTDAVSYRVEEYVASVWTARGSTVADGRGYYSFLTRALEDEAVHLFRVIPVDGAGNDGTALELEVPMRRVPDVPEGSAVYDSGTGKITVTID